MPQFILQLAVVVLAVFVVSIVVAVPLSAISTRVRTFLVRRMLQPIYRMVREEDTAQEVRREDRARRQVEIRAAIKDMTAGLYGYTPGDTYVHHEELVRFRAAASTLRLECPTAGPALDALLEFTSAEQWNGYDQREELRKRINAVTDAVAPELREDAE